MKRIVYFFIFIAFAASAFTARAGWKNHNLPGGTALETIVVDEYPIVQGMWVVEKSGGMYWLEWDPQHPWGEEGSPDYEEFDAYYPWFMGGDIKEIDGTLYTIAATYQGTHLYEYNTSGGKWQAISTEPERNSYYRWHDAAFCAGGSGNYNRDFFIVSAVQEWYPDPQHPYLKGLFLITDGQAPDPEDPPIEGTSGNDYQFIYRHPDPERGYWLYTWHGGSFQRITVSGTYPNINAAADRDFLEEDALDEIACFYQYKDAYGIYHQYIVANRGTEDDPLWDVWHRVDTGSGFQSDGWDVVCQDLQEGIGDYGFMGIAAYYYDSNPDEHHIYLNIQKNGLARIDVDPDYPADWDPVWLNTTKLNTGNSTRAIHVTPE